MYWSIGEVQGNVRTGLLACLLACLLVWNGEERDEGNVYRLNEYHRCLLACLWACLHSCIWSIDEVQGNAGTDVLACLFAWKKELEDEGATSIARTSTVACLLACVLVFDRLVKYREMLELDSLLACLLACLFLVPLERVRLFFLVSLLCFLACLRTCFIVYWLVCVRAIVLVCVLSCLLTCLLACLLACFSVGLSTSNCAPK